MQNSARQLRMPPWNELHFYSGWKEWSYCQSTYSLFRLKTWAEVQKLTLTNNSAAVKKLKIFSFTEWCLWNAAADMENFQRNFSTGEVEIEGSVIYHKTEYKERRDHYAYYSVNTPITGFDTDRETFFGLYNGFDEPQVVAEGNPTNTVAHGWSPIASHCIEVELQPGESKDFVFVLGYVENARRRKMGIEKYNQ